MLDESAEQANVWVRKEDSKANKLNVTKECTRSNRYGTAAAIMINIGVDSI